MSPAIEKISEPLIFLIGKVKKNFNQRNHINHINLWFGLFFFLSTAFAQQQPSTCTNADFEQGSFNGWTGTTGSCCPSCNINSNTPGIVNGRHTIMSGAGTDPNSCNNIPYIYPDGGLYSARLGNSMVGAQGECLSYQFNVTSTNALFIYRFAVILEDPSHTACEQPRFNLTVRDQNNNIIPCGSYSVAAGGSVSGFQNCGSVRWRPWTSVGLDLSPYIGQTLTARFCTGDCDQSGHFGYAYIDAICQPLQLTTNYCIGDNIAIITAPAGFTYSWSGPNNFTSTAQIVNITGPVDGSTYTVTLTSVLGCQASLNTVLQPVNPTANFSSASLCYNGVQFNDSSITAANTSITNWQWNFGDGATDIAQNPIHTYASQANYNVTLIVTNSAGCKDTIVKTVNTTPVPIPQFTSTGDCVVNPVSFTDQSTFSGGITQWHWDFGETGISNDTSDIQSPSYTFSAPGTYNVMLVAYSSAGCNDTIYKTLTINSFFDPTFTPDTFCNNEPPLNLTSSMSGGTWSGTGITNSAMGTFNPVNSGIGIFQVTYIGGTGACRDSSTQDIIVDGVAITGVTTNNVSCFRSMNGTLSIIANGAAQYTIDNGSGPITQTNGNFSGLDTGTYLITVTSAINNCQKTSSAVITEPQLLSIAFSSFDAKCYNQCDGYAVVIPGGGTPNYTFLWSNGSPNIAVDTSLCDGAYSLTVTDFNNCTTDTAFIINEPDDYFIDLITVNSNCGHPDGLAEIDSISGQTAPYYYSWNNGVPDSSNINLVDGNYILTITDANNCDTVLNAAVGYNPPPSANAVMDSTKCFGSCDGLATANGIGGNPQPTPTYTYLWNNGQTDSTATGLCAGAYTVTVYDEKLCEGYFSIVVQQPTQIQLAPFPDDTICIDSSGTIGVIANGGTPPYTYSWENGTYTDSVNTVLLISPTCYTVIVKDINDCESNPQVQCISLFPQLFMLATGSTTICEGFSAEISAFAFGGNPNNTKTYSWSDGDTNQFRTIIPSGNINNPFILTVTASDNCSPPVSDIITIDFYPQPVAEFVADTMEGCEADPVFNVIFTNTSYTNTSPTLNNPLSCIWTISDGSGFVPDCDSFIHPFPDVGFYDVTFSVVSENSCPDSETKAEYIKIYPKPKADFSYVPQPTDVQNMNIVFTDLSEGSAINQWQWDYYDNDGVTLLGNNFTQNSVFNFSSEPDNPFIFYLTDTGNYPVQLLIKTDKNCMDSIAKEVRVNGVFYVNVPNAFTPNGDGINDYFFPVGVGIQPEQDFRFLILNRWGDIIFESKSLDDPWDGTARSVGGKTLVQQGVYVWKLDLRDASVDQLKHKLSGHVTLIR